MSDIGRQMVASSIGSFVTVLILNPLNVIKVRLQKQHTIESNRSSTIRSVLRDILKGPNVYRTLWAGASSGLMMSVPNTVMYMVAYEQCKLSMASELPEKMLPAVAGASARAFAVTLISPIELVRTMQTGGVKGSAWNIMKNVSHQYGLSGLYRGWSSTILRDCPFSAIYWFSVESSRPLIQNYLDSSSWGQPWFSQQRGKYHSLSTFIAGALSGMVSALATHPFDVIKTHRQLSPSSEAFRRPGIYDEISLQTIFKNHGWQGIYRGLSIRLFTVIPASAIMITIYESLK